MYIVLATLPSCSHDCYMNGIRIDMAFLSVLLSILEGYWPDMPSVLMLLWCGKTKALICGCRLYPSLGRTLFCISDHIAVVYHSGSVSYPLISFVYENTNSWLGMLGYE